MKFLKQVVKEFDFSRDEPFFGYEEEEVPQDVPTLRWPEDAVSTEDRGPRAIATQHPDTGRKFSKANQLRQARRVFVRVADSEYYAKTNKSEVRALSKHVGGWKNLRFTPKGFDLYVDVE